MDDHKKAALRAARRWYCALIGSLVLLFARSAATFAIEPVKVDFAAEIQPLLAKHCSACHGGVKREGGVSFVDPRDALGEADSGLRPIVPGRPEESELLRRVAADDPDERMPPLGAPLTAEQIELLRRWIIEGAEWPQHWSFRPIERPEIPSLNGVPSGSEQKAAGTLRAPSANSRLSLRESSATLAEPKATLNRIPGSADGTRSVPANLGVNPIDAFILARLRTENIEPSPQADRYTLIRRLYFDLIGLPPTPEEVDAYLTDASPDAYERLVDRLLASPHFGERWGRHWLDQARYADTDGYEVDSPRLHAWRWRDWVIRAINSDLPFDQFTAEQLAGDLLPNATIDQKLATAFHRQTLTNNEGGIDKEEYRVYAVMDRVHTTAVVWLGLTAGCTQCHNHPYDPLSQREFYQWFAFFNNADETELELPQEPRVKLSILTERSEPRTTHLFERGNFLAPRTDEAILPATPAVLHPLRPRDADEPADRLDLARWIVDPANPLTARVAANDLWLHLFGEGLVRTPGDFGTQGQRPTHPDLLDWLASEYVRLGWSRKAMIQRIVASSAYRQSSRRRPEMEERDPENRLLARQNRFRLEAEAVRDVHLEAAGLLTRRIGGPSVFPPFPQDLTKIDFRSDLQWETSTGANRYRRGMYTFFKRTLPYPTLIAFDCPDGAATTVQRSRSNTPLQALATLNNEVFVEAAQALGRRVMASKFADDEERIAYVWRLCLTRPPTDFERARMLRLLQDHRQGFAEHKNEAVALTGENSDDPVTATETAAWIATANVLLNLDEAITRE